MNTKIFHANNSALYFMNGEDKILIDGIYGGDYVTGETIKDVGMSEMPDDYRKMMEIDSGFFSDIDLLLFTHNHHDHYNNTKILEYKEKHPQMLYFEPASPNNNFLMEYCADDISMKELKSTEVYAISTKHLDLGKSLKKFSQVNHCSFLINSGKEKIFVAGDGELDDELYNLLENRGLNCIDCVFVNVIHLLTKNNMSFLKKIKPKNIVLYHLPNREDDSLNYWALMEQAKKRHPVELSPLIVANHMEWLELS